MLQVGIPLAHRPTFMSVQHKSSRAIHASQGVPPARKSELLLEDVLDKRQTAAAAESNRP